ncbi:MAG TPA: bifunctional diguanylate cyclase/phosphodiesterase [Jatrophihabitantaceae bacterium]
MRDDLASASTSDATDPVTGLSTLATLRALDSTPVRWTKAPRMTVFSIDIDRFRSVNDLLGYELGDELLDAVGQRLAGWASPGGLAARVSADQFVIVCPGHGGDTAAGARQIGDLVARPVELDGMQITRSASIGYASGRIGVDPVMELYRCADAAKRVAQASGGDGQRAFDPAMSDEAFAAAEIELHLGDAVDSDALRLVYQPELDLRTGRLLALEALLRWEHPTRGRLGPDQFIDIAEESKLICEVGEWVLRESCRQRASWEPLLDGRPLVVRVNLSIVQLGDRGLVDLVAGVLAEAGVAGDQLCLEITERAVPHNADHVAEVLSRLRAIGVTTAIDDFGTGHNSFAYLKSLPVDVLKIDRSFTAGLGTDRGDTAIVEALVQLADRLGLDIVAEGVETEAAAAELLRVGCHRAQGHLFSEAVPANHLDALVEAGEFAPIRQ